MSVFANAGPEGSDEGVDRVRGQSSVQARLFDVGGSCRGSAGWPGAFGRGRRFAEPPAESPSTMKIFIFEGEEQSRSLPGMEAIRRPLWCGPRL